MYRLPITLLLAIFSYVFVFATEAVKAVYAPVPPVIDGRTDEPVWENAGRVSEFFQREPYEGRPVTERTEFLILYDEENLYIAARCFHKDPGDIISRELARDVNLGFEDRIQIILDTYLDGRNGYWFQIGPRGSIGDALVSENGRGFNKAWDGIWDGRTTIHEQGWDAEIVIPFRILGFNQNRDTWGIKLIRNIKKRSESSYWPRTTVDAERFQISDAGRLTGLKNMSQGIGLDIVPYFTFGSSKSPEPEVDYPANLGGDIFYQVTPSLKAALTINTDFAQTEVDARQINLTRFSLFFPEKRDFFLDGANYFNFGLTGDSENPMQNKLIPFFSRRVGLNSEGNPVPVEYGGKFTGQAGNWNIGMLHIKDRNEWDNPGYSVARVSRNLGKQSYIGIIGTNGNALSTDNNSTAGMDLQLATSEIGGSKTLVFSLYGLRSFTDTLHDQEGSWGAEINYPNDFLNIRAGVMEIGQNFNPGLGFVPRKNIRNLYGEAEIGLRPEKYGLLRVRSGVDYLFVHELGSGSLLTYEIDAGILKLDFLSGDEVRFSWAFQYERLLEDFPIFGNITIPEGEYNFNEYEISLRSARQRDLWGEIDFSSGSFYTGNRTGVEIRTGFQVAPPLFVGFESLTNRVDLPEGDFVARVYRINLNFLFTPRITWYNFAQYDNVSERMGIQSRFQWILKPGREIFLVWNSPTLSNPLERFRVEDYEARAKIKYTLSF